MPATPHTLPAALLHLPRALTRRAARFLDLWRAEDALYDLTRTSGQRTVILCDRGMPDAAAYISEDAFQTLLDEHDWLLDRMMARYSLVSCTAADTHSAYRTHSP